MNLTVRLPVADGSVENYALTGNPVGRPTSPPRFNRIAYAAAHVVSDPWREHDPWGRPAIDWDSTIAFRHHLWSLGFKIAEAMDTSQRGMGLDWAGAQELISRSLAASRTVEGADLACGAGTDHLAPADARSLEDVIAAYETQLEFVEKHGGRAIMMASRALARVASSAEDYRTVYRRILSQAHDKVVLHWLGPMFDPQLSGYWGSDHFETALETVLSIIEENRDKVEGIKISLLDNTKEIALRKRLPAGVLCFTGDDFNYADLIEDHGDGYSHALLGIFDAVAPQASLALASLAQATSRHSAPSCNRPCRCRARFSRLRPSITRLAWCSSPGSTATRTTLPCRLACSRPAGSCIMPRFSGWQTRPMCSTGPILRPNAWAISWPCISTAESSGGREDRGAADSLDSQAAVADTGPGALGDVVSLKPGMDEAGVEGIAGAGGVDHRNLVCRDMGAETGAAHMGTV